MFSKGILHLIRRNASRMQRMQMSQYAPSLKEPHMNDVPVPHESFKTGYQRRQVGNNFVLLSGIVFFSLSFGFVINSGVIVPNLTPPRKNAD